MPFQECSKKCVWFGEKIKLLEIRGGDTSSRHDEFAAAEIFKHILFCFDIFHSMQAKE